MASIEQALPPPRSLTAAQTELWNKLCKRLVVLNERTWEMKVNGPVVTNWLSNFTGLTGASEDKERLHALFLLSQFTYFGQREIRVLLKAVYRDLFLLPLIRKLRLESGLAGANLVRLVESEIALTRFLGVGNPSESGVHLLYYFRQENNLSKSSFLDSGQLFERSTGANGEAQRRLADSRVTRYVFIDDICGTGETVEKYAQNLLPDMVLPGRTVDAAYVAIFGTAAGLARARQTAFGENVSSIFELDSSYRYCDPQSRYLPSCAPPELDAALLTSLCSTYGEVLWPGNSLGFDDSQLLVGFSHNTPDNTLPIIWSDPSNGSQVPWHPIFRRHPKI